MTGVCLVCGADLSTTAEQICIACETNGLGICIECFSFNEVSSYCCVCMMNLQTEDLDDSLESDLYSISKGVYMDPCQKEYFQEADDEIFMDI